MERRQREPWSGVTSPQQFRVIEGGRDKSVGPADDASWQRSVETAHTIHWAAQGFGAPPPDREANAAKIRAAAAARARATGRSVAEVLAEAGFHPVSGMSMRPGPRQPHYETSPHGLVDVSDRYRRR